MTTLLPGEHRAPGSPARSRIARRPRLLLTGRWRARSGRGARALAAFAGVGPILFEASELLWLGRRRGSGCHAGIARSVGTGGG